MFGDGNEKMEEAVWHKIERSGDIAVARFIIKTIPESAAAPFEEMDMMLGDSIEHHPTLVLRLLAEHTLNVHQFRGAVVDTGREEDRRIIEGKYKRRIHALKTVQKPALQDEKKLALAFLTGKTLPSKYPESMLKHSE